VKCIIWDVQHGSAATVVTPNNKYIAIDLGTGSFGSNNTTFSPLLHLKSNFNVSQLHTVILTHPHRDHLDDICNFDALSPQILHRANHLTEDDIRKGNQVSDKNIIDKYLEIDKRYNQPVTDDLHFQNPNNLGGVKIQTFIPYTSATSNINNHSVVTVLTYAGSKMIIPGDNEPSAWKELLKDSSFLAAISGTDIFVAPHHGRESGYCSELFDKISPKLVIVSDGRFTDTSFTNTYSQKASGWKVHKRNGGTSVQRNCITTRQDGVISVEFTENATQRFIVVTID
jgi:beta-lactamase superfamily II metal-dependent hydrolase